MQQVRFLLKKGKKKSATCCPRQYNGCLITTFMFFFNRNKIIKSYCCDMKEKEFVSTGEFFFFFLIIKRSGENDGYQKDPTFIHGTTTMMKCPLSKGNLLDDSVELGALVKSLNRLVTQEICRCNFKTDRVIA
jgi:hypothetical protein